MGKALRHRLSARDPAPRQRSRPPWITDNENEIERPSVRISVIRLSNDPRSAARRPTPPRATTPAQRPTTVDPRPTEIRPLYREKSPPCSTRFLRNRASTTTTTAGRMALYVKAGTQ